jgi:hypothetical protein
MEQKNIPGEAPARSGVEKEEGKTEGEREMKEREGGRNET